MSSINKNYITYGITLEGTNVTYLKENGPHTYTAINIEIEPHTHALFIQTNELPVAVNYRKTGSSNLCPEFDLYLVMCTQKGLRSISQVHTKTKLGSSTDICWSTVGSYPKELFRPTTYRTLVSDDLFPIREPGLAKHHSPVKVQVHGTHPIVMCTVEEAKRAALALLNANIALSHNGVVHIELPF